MRDRTTSADPPAQPETDEDFALVSAAKANPEAFSRLYDRYVQPIYRYLHSRVGDAAEAEDLTSQTFLAAMEGLERYRHQGHFPAWLFTIARSKVMDHFRRARREAVLDDAEPATAETDPLLQVMQTERSRMLAKMISQLSGEEREWLRLRFTAGLTFDQMAALLGKNEAAVKKSFYRLLARMEDQVEEFHD